jgi:pimeloyl-ACP methyl ester carboxylesterase
MSERVVPFTATDGVECNLVNVRGPARPERGPVLLVHGAGVRANIFRPPVETSIVDYLVDRGYDVWLENWRASIDLSPTRWDLEQAAVHDHPVAVATVLEETGATELKAIIHCQGSTSFMMSLAAGLVPQVTTVVSNAVSLHPVVPRFARFKLDVAVPVVRRLIDHLDPHWGLDPPAGAPRVLSMLVNAVHHECDNPVCKQVSFTYGSGFPALWRHENLNPATHEWLKQEFGFVPLTFFSEIARCVRRGRLMSEGTAGPLPRDFCAQAPKTDARLALFAGARNRCFLPRSQVRTFEYLDAHRPGFHSLHVLPHYSHLDVFIGKDAHRDVFPLMAAELEREGSTS